MLASHKGTCYCLTPICMSCMYSVFIGTLEVDSKLASQFSLVSIIRIRPDDVVFGQLKYPSYFKATSFTLALSRWNISWGSSTPIAHEASCNLIDKAASSDLMHICTFLKCKMYLVYCFVTRTVSRETTEFLSLREHLQHQYQTISAWTGCSFVLSLVTLLGTKACIDA